MTEQPTEAIKMTDQASEYMELLGTIPNQSMLLTKTDVLYPEDCPVAASSDMLWLTWWTHVVGPTPTMVLAYLHHLGRSGTKRVSLQDVADWITPVDAPGINDSYPLHRIHWALTRLGMHRLAGVAPIRIGGAPEVLILANGIPRPGPLGFEAIGEAMAQLTNGTSGMVKGLGDPRG